MTTTNEIDLVGALTALQKVVGEHCRRVVTGEPVTWDGLGDLLDLGAQHCYERACQETRLADRPASQVAQLPD